MSKNVNIVKCECLVSKDELEQYDELVKNARQLEKEGKTADATSHYLDALELKSCDIELQTKVMLLMRDAK